MDKETLSTRERDSWAAFRAAVDRLTATQKEHPGMNADGWSVKDVLWHIAHWWTDLAGMLDEMREGAFAEPPEDDEATNAENAKVLEQSARMSLADVEQGVQMARGRMLSAWAALPEVDEPAERWFVWETIEHYEEHLADAQRFAAEVGGKG